MKKRILGILLSLCMVLALTPVVAIADEPTITISGPDEICSEQDYKFIVTASEGVDLDRKFNYEGSKGDSGYLMEADGDFRGIVLGGWLDGSQFVLTVSGKTVDGTSVTATKTVKISSNHLFVNGVCECGATASEKYDVEYKPGSEGTGYIEPGIKTHGVDFILSSQTFTREGYVQTGWAKFENGPKIYNLGGTLSRDENVTLYPAWEKETLTYEVPFTTTVELGGSVAPGKTTFNLVALTPNGDKLAPGDVEITASVTTNGEGSYSGTMSFTGTHDQLKEVFSVGDSSNPYGVFVQQANEGKANWTYDEKVWCLVLANADYDSEYVAIFPASCEESDNGKRYYVKWAEPAKDQMTFKNIYTENAGGATEGDNSANSTKDSQDGNAIPQTGDNSFILVAVLVIAAVSSLIGVGVSVRRNRKRGLHAK